MVTIDEATHGVTYNLNYYLLGQMSRYVRPGAVRVGSERWVADFKSPTGSYGVTRGLDNVAFLNPDGSKVLLAYNSSATRQSFAFASRGRYFSDTLPARAMATFIWDRPG